MHVRYDQAHFPEDLVFQATSDRTNFQGRFILQRPWKGEMQCEQAEAYRHSVWTRQKEEARTLAELTGWKLEEIERKMGITEAPSGGKKKWYERIWNE